MRYRETDPPVQLAGLVDAIWTLESRPDEDTSEVGTIVPDGCIEIVLSLGAPVRPSPSSRRAPLSRFIVGQMERAWRVGYTGRVSLLGVRLHPAAARSFMSVEPAAIANRVVPLRMAAPATDERLSRWIEASRPSRRQLATVLQLTASEAPAPDALVRVAVDRMGACAGVVRIAQVAAELGLSPRQFERRFVRAVGLPPKRWCRIVRFRAASDVGQHEEVAWSDRSAEFGYADQAHLVREFAGIAGVTPTRLWWTRPRRRISSRSR